MLQREFRSIETRYGAVAVKLGIYKNNLVSAEPEFEECAALAEKRSIPVKLVLQEARGKASELFDKD